MCCFYLKSFAENVLQLHVCIVNLLVQDIAGELPEQSLSSFGVMHWGLCFSIHVGHQGNVDLLFTCRTLDLAF